MRRSDAGSSGSALRKGAKSQKELIDISIDCFARYGYQGTSVDRIAKAAAVTKGAIYYYFRDKEALLAAMVANRVTAFEDRVQQAVEGARCPEALRRIAGVCIDHAQSGAHPRFAITLMVESIETNAEVSAQLREMMRRFRAFVRNLIQAGQERCEIRPDADAVAAAAAYNSIILGAEIQYYQDPDRFAFRAAIETFLDQLLADLTRGLPGTSSGEL
jgi:TetR/AcrR family acrAB operon transcriptional repressor